MRRTKEKTFEIDESKKKIKKQRLRLIITYKGEKLNKEKALRVLGALKPEHCHWLGKARPAELTGNCSGEHGRHVGEGVCILYIFLEKRPHCRRCRSDEIPKQLNHIFESCKPFAGKELRAEWY